MESPLAAAPPFDGPQVSSIVAEIIVGRHRVTGELRFQGVPRRFLDIMNTIEGAYAVVHGAGIDVLNDGGSGRRRFDAVQVHRDSILFATERVGVKVDANPFEVVQKVAVPATIVLPGFEISGTVYKAPDADPIRVAMVGTRHFIPVADATIVCSYGDASVATEWREDLVAVNMARAILYAPGPKRD